ncbi:TrkH family potassium uptake protein [Pasteurellaceae bacterium LIM206]|nr:TrkH family potassium uptake protein [Pasteurellaceae bacterium LIM206]
MHILSIIRIVGILIICFSLTMLLPASVALIYGDGGGKSFVQAFFINVAVGIVLWRSCHTHKEELRSREGFLIVVAFWLVLGTLGTIPFLFLDPHLDLTVADAIFESFSGLTTTGATVISGLDQLPKAILFYRQLLQFLGGMGLIVLAVAVLPLLGINNTQLFRAESSGPMKDQKIRPRIAEVAKWLWIVYVGLTIVCAIAFRLAGMDWFDAICHSFSTVSNGGFSTHDASLRYFKDNTIYVIAAVFMFVAGINFSLHIAAVSHIHRHGKFWAHYTKDPEFRFFLWMQLTFIVIFSLGLYFTRQEQSLVSAFSAGSAQLLSMSMTAGYTLFDFNNLPGYLSMLLIFSAVLGGCAGSTSGGIKAVRVLILGLQVKRELAKMSHPNLIQPMKLGNNIVPLKVVENAWTFLLVFLLIFWVCVFLAIISGMSDFDAISGVLATLTNAGPGIGSIHENFGSSSESAKLVFAFAMLCGRLEIFSLLVLFTPAFWKA